MNKKISLVLVCLLAGALYILIPHFIFPVCDLVKTDSPHAVAAMAGHVHAGMDMGEATGAVMEAVSTAKAVCFYTAKAELGLGILIILGAIWLMAVKNPGQRSGIMAMQASAAVVGALFPTALIGVCASESMPCRAGTLPALVILSVLFFLFSIVGYLRACKNK
jgi:hypothetical protein